MCLLSYYPPGKQPDLSRLMYGAERNEDGHGYAIVTTSRKPHLIVGKSMDSAKAIAEFAEQRDLNPGGPAMFHSRFGTSGIFGEYNCHPFQMGRDTETVIGHNGVLGPVHPQEMRCDTHLFADQIMPVYYHRLDKPSARRALEKYIGSYNKLVILTSNKRYRHSAYIINEQAGHWVNGEWHSNLDYLPPLKKYGKYVPAAGGRYWWDYTGDEEDGLAPQFLADDASCGPCVFCHCESVDAVSQVCSACEMCNDCGEWGGACSCYVPAGSTEPARAVTTTAHEAIVVEPPWEGPLALEPPREDPGSEAEQSPGTRGQP